jgi:hypothetical protein
MKPKRGQPQQEERLIYLIPELCAMTGLWALFLAFTFFITLHYRRCFKFWETYWKLKITEDYGKVVTLCNIRCSTIRVNQYNYHGKLRHVVWRHVTWCDVMSRGVMSCHVVWCHQIVWLYLVCQVYRSPLWMTSWFVKT